MSVKLLPDPAAPATPPPPARRARSQAARKPPADQRQPGESQSEFESRHARDESGKFTAGADLNHGPAKDEPSLGKSGPKVTALQRLLNDLGYDNDGKPLPTDGEFGPMTVAALAAAQHRLGIAGEDGWLGPQTRAALRAERDKAKGGGARRSRSRSGRASAGGGGDPKDAALQQRRLADDATAVAAATGGTDSSAAGPPKPGPDEAPAPATDGRTPEQLDADMRDLLRQLGYKQDRIDAIMAGITRR